MEKRQHKTIVTFIAVLLLVAVFVGVFFKSGLNLSPTPDACPAIVTTQAPSSCVDSDGNNIYNKGYIELKFGLQEAPTITAAAIRNTASSKYWDGCSSKSRICELTCNGKMPKTQVASCPNGYYCSDGKCMQKVCGNNITEEGEECDGIDLKNQTCSDFGYNGGELACGANCTFTFGNCVGGQSDQCFNEILDGDETDTDCGGSVCYKCDLGKQCLQNSDCMSNNCTGGVCARPSFLDNYPACVPIKLEDGDYRNSMNIVIVGAWYDFQNAFQKDGTFGYDKYVSDVKRFAVDNFLNIAPYENFSKINVFRVDDLAGSSTWTCKHQCTPDDSWNCSSINCSSPNSPTWNETACRLVQCTSGGPIGARVRQCPYDIMPAGKSSIVLINDDYYGGSGMYTSFRAFITRDERVVGLARHELLGHTLGNLADEYVKYESPYLGEQHYDLNCDTSVNCTRWSDMVEIFPEVTCVQGCGYYASGINRGTNNSLMKELGQPFYSVNERIICCKFLQFTGEISASCEKFNSNGLNLSEFCASSNAKSKSQKLFVVSVSENEKDFTLAESGTEDIELEKYSEPSALGLNVVARDAKGEVLEAFVLQEMLNVPLLPKEMSNGKPASEYMKVSEIPSNVYQIAVKGTPTRIEISRGNKKTEILV